MLVYPAPVFLADSAAAFCGTSTVSQQPAQPQAFCVVPVSFECVRPAQAYMHPGNIVLCASVAESGESALPTQKTESGESAAPAIRRTNTTQSTGSWGSASAKQPQKKRRRKQAGGAPSTQSKVASPKNASSPKGNQTGSAVLSFTDSNSQLPPNTKRSQKKMLGQKSAPKMENTNERLQACAKSNNYCTGDTTSRDASELGEDTERCNQMIEQLETEGPSRRAAFASLLPVTKELALSRCGCRVIQKAMAVGSDDEVHRLVETLKSDLPELYRSPNGNYVVAKMIEVLRPASLGFIFRGLQGIMLNVARHQYGSRVVQRLLEHCSAEQLELLVAELLSDAEPLCRHPYGNFAVQHIFEHGSQTWKQKVIDQIADVLPHLAMHRTASHVVQRALKNGGPDIQNTLVSALVYAEGEESLVNVGCSRYGSYVVEELASLQREHPAWYEQVRQILQDDLARLTEDKYGKRAISKFGLLPEPCGPAASDSQQVLPQP